MIPCPQSWTHHELIGTQNGRGFDFGSVHATDTVTLPPGGVLTWKVVRVVPEIGIGPARVFAHLNSPCGLKASEAIITSLVSIAQFSVLG